ncbi:hypothetical protein [Lactococcus cremoris]|nr:hypothetical protein [Lactococcus cremoris]
MSYKGGLRVRSAQNGMNIQVGSGSAVIEGSSYLNDADIGIQVNVASSIQDRVDSVVLRMDKNARTTQLFYKPGDTTVARNDTTYELQLAKISVKTNATQITDADITDMRSDFTVCGWSTPFDNINVDGIVDQYKGIFTQADQDFQKWFEDVKGQLSEDAAGHLQNQLDSLDSKVYTAYANSADGTNGFTTVYPNLNLLINSSAKTKDGFFKDFDKVENGYGEVAIWGKNGYVTRNLWDGFSINPRDYKPGDTYTMSMDIMFTSWNMPAGASIGEFWMGQRYTWGGGNVGAWNRITYIELPKDNSKILNQWIRITQTSTVPSYSEPAVNTEANFITQFNGTSMGSFIIRVRKPKLEKGSIATPHMPSASEVTTADWPQYKYVGRMTGLNVANKNDPKNYKWQRNTDVVRDQNGYTIFENVELTGALKIANDVNWTIVPGSSNRAEYMRRGDTVTIRWDFTSAGNYDISLGSLPTDFAPRKRTFKSIPEASATNSMHTLQINAFTGGSPGAITLFKATTNAVFLGQESFVIV